MDTALPFLNVTKDDEYEPLWDVYGSVHSNFTRRRPYMLGIGNHEAWYNWTATTTRYPMHTSSSSPAAARARPPFWYTFESGGVHWTMLSSEHDYTTSSPQHDFARAALGGVDRTRTPWSVVAFHRPMYSSDKFEYPSSSAGGPLQTHLEPLLVGFAVDLVITGDDRATESITLPDLA